VPQGGMSDSKKRQSLAAGAKEKTRKTKKQKRCYITALHKKRKSKRPAKLAICRLVVFLGLRWRLFRCGLASITP
jgi:hypothetical protein